MDNEVYDFDEMDKCYIVELYSHSGGKVFYCKTHQQKFEVTCFNTFPTVCYRIPKKKKVIEVK